MSTQPVQKNRSRPKTPVEQILAEIWQQLLRTEQVDISDDFFKSGGDSLRAVQFISRVRDTLGVELPLRALFDAPTIAGLCDAIEALNRSGDRSDRATVPTLRRSNQEAHDRFSNAGCVADAPTGDCRARASPGPRGNKEMQFSLFFFSADGSTQENDKYRLLLESAKLADRRGFTAVWTPERHFHEFGGLYPNPSVIGAALAMVTERIQIRAGSVVLPLQDPLRVAEEWAVVDNLSNGRVAIACASGWNANDFVLSPDNYGDRKRVMVEQLETVQRLWRGERIKLLNGAGEVVEVAVYPRPLQSQLPIWLACHSDGTFLKAAELGANVVTTIWKTTVENVKRQIALYRDALARHGFDPQLGTVTLMLHTYVDDNIVSVKNEVSTAYGGYLESHLGLHQSQMLGPELPNDIAADDKEFIVTAATERLFNGRGLIGTPEMCLEMIDTARGLDVDEIACLIDFGIGFQAAMASLERLASLKERLTSRSSV